MGVSSSWWQLASRGLSCTCQVSNKLISPILVSEPLAERVPPLRPLRSCHRPSNEIAVLRTYWRQRGSLVEQAARAIQLMQQSLEQMNLQIHKAISDLAGVTGMAILRAILAGEHAPRARAKHRAPRRKCPEAELVAAQSLSRSKSALGAFFRRMRARLGAPKAITATAHKLACLIYRMMRFGME